MQKKFDFLKEKFQKSNFFFKKNRKFLLAQKIFIGRFDHLNTSRSQTSKLWLIGYLNLCDVLHNPHLEKKTKIIKKKLKKNVYIGHPKVVDVQHCPISLRYEGRRGGRGFCYDCIITKLLNVTTT